jgi:hypothetical protein
MNEDFLTLDQFPDAMKRVENVFHVNRRLPEQVFKRPYRFHLLFDFDLAMSHVLEMLRKTHSSLASETLLLSVLDPDPINYFYKHFQKINAFYFKADITENEYHDIRWRSPGNPADAIMFNTDIETYIPSSASWAIWGERSRSIAVIGLDDPEIVKYLVEDDGYWTDAETALEDFASMPYRGQKVPEDFRRTLIANYGTKKDLEDKLGHSKR